uniref:Uncharacterized protein n=1 Tax=Globisporangium ultimum (strain ATCC 200006 / CBS 805.95 / DAOM BR144) TaxID=431595 RepID=K3WZP5_GLOUD
MLIQEWLVFSKFHMTQRCFVDECKQKGKPLPLPESWYHMTEQLQFDLPLRQGSSHYDTKRLPGALALSLLDKVVQFVIVERQKDVIIHRQQQQHPTVLITKKTPAKEFKFMSKRLLPASASAPTLRKSLSTPAHAEPSLVSKASLRMIPPAFRPKSAVVCKNASELITKSLFGGSSSAQHGASSSPAKSTSNNDHPASTAEVARQSKMRPVSAAGSLTPNRDSQSKKSSHSIEVSSQSIAHQQSAPRHPSLQRKSIVPGDSAKDLGQLVDQRHASRVSTSGLPFFTEDQQNRQYANHCGEEDELDEAESATLETSVLELEEMSEGRLISQYSSLDKPAIKKIRRVLAKSNACTQEFEKTKQTIDKIQTRAKLRQLRRDLTAEQTPLLSSTMDSLNKEACSLCQYVFLKKNLVMRVSYKCIYDLRLSWATQKKKHELDDQVEAATNKCGPEESNSDEDEQRDDDQNDEVGRAQQAHLYNEVPICAFCSQLVLNLSSYRPSSAERKTQCIEHKRHASERQKAREAAHVRELARCDPLDFDSYRLNSEDDDSEVEEMLEFNADGRPHVVKRRRQKTGRVPAQLGLVSKRLHYDQLRSRTLPTLNNKEWQIIT